MSTEERLPPNYRKLDVALRSIGYSFEVDVADIIDNSIDERATNVLVRLFTRTPHSADTKRFGDAECPPRGMRAAFRHCRPDAG